MTFLNPLILWGLLAVSIPIIIHIFNLKKTKKIEFSTLMFLKEIQQSKYKKIKLKQLLILLCRIAMIILLVMAFARPFEKGYLGADGKARSSVLLILDNSFSMQSRQQQGQDFEIAKSKILETINLLDEEDEIFYTTTSDIDKPDGVNLFKDRNALKDSVSNTKISDVTRYLNEVLFYAKRIITSSSNPYKEIFIFTDGQKNFIEGLSSIPVKMDLDEFTKVNIILTGVRNGNNISLDTINTVTKIFERNRNVKLKCTVNNRNNFNVSDKSVVLNFADGKYRDEKVIDIPANSSVEAEFSFTPEVTGFAGGYIEIVQSEISDDEIVNDNKRYFSFYVPPKVKILLASGTPTAPEFIKLALTSSEEMMRDSLNNTVNYFEIKESGAGSIVNENLNNYDCIVLTAYPSFTSAEADKMYEYVQSGGGVVIYPGAGINADNYNNVLLKRFELPPFNGSFNATDNEHTFIFDNIDIEHPIFEGIFKDADLQQKNYIKESPKIKNGINLLSGINTQTLVRLNNEKSFLNEYTSGKGKILIYSITPDMVNSDFPASNLFSPLTVRSILYLAGGNQMKEAVNGRDYFAELRTIPDNRHDSLKIKDKLNHENIVIVQSSTSLLNIKKYISFTSNYSVSQTGIPLLEFSSNFDVKESSIEKSTPEDINRFTKEAFGSEFNVISPLNTVNTAVFKLRTGNEIWHYFLIAALVFIVLEFIISRSMTKIPK